VDLAKTYLPYGCIFGIGLLFNLLVVVTMRIMSSLCLLGCWCFVALQHAVCGGYSFSAVLSVSQF